MPASRTDLTLGRAGGAVPAGRAAPLGPPSPLAAAAAAGLAGERVTDLSRSHLVHRIDGADGSCVVKRLDLDRVQKGRSLRAEHYVYRLAAWLPGLAPALPRPLLIDERRQVLVMAAADPAWTGSALLDRGELPTAAAAGLVARTLGTVHTVTQGVPLPQDASRGVLDLLGTPDEELLLARPAARELAGHLRADPVLADGLREASTRWTACCLVHADLKWDNCLFDGAAAEVLLIDWELAGAGDPAWDVAGLLAQAAALSTDRAAPALDLSAEVGAVVDGYTATASPTGDFWERCGWYWPARVIHLALESAEAGGAPVRLLELARELTRTADATGRQLDPRRAA